MSTPDHGPSSTGQRWLKAAIVAVACFGIPPLCFGLFVAGVGCVFAGWEEPTGPLILTGGAIVFACLVWLAYFRWLYLFKFPRQPPKP